MCLEALAACVSAEPAEELELPLASDAAGVWRSDCAPLAAMLLDARRSPEQRAACLHASLAAALCAQAIAVRSATGVTQVGLCGGVFQNRILAEAALERLTREGFQTWLPERLPANDAAISFGQLIETAAATG